jgi:hypothetical protein
MYVPTRPQGSLIIPSFVSAVQSARFVKFAACGRPDPMCSLYGKGPQKGRVGSSRRGHTLTFLEQGGPIWYICAPRDSERESDLALECGKPGRVESAQRGALHGSSSPCEGQSRGCLFSLVLQDRWITGQPLRNGSPPNPRYGMVLRRFFSQWLCAHIRSQVNFKDHVDGFVRRRLRERFVEKSSVFRQARH